MPPKKRSHEKVSEHSLPPDVTIEEVTKKTERKEEGPRWMSHSTIPKIQRWLETVASKEKNNQRYQLLEAASKWDKEILKHFLSGLKNIGKESKFFEFTQTELDKIAQLDAKILAVFADKGIQLIAKIPESHAKSSAIEEKNAIQQQPSEKIDLIEVIEWLKNNFPETTESEQRKFLYQASLFKIKDDIQKIDAAFQYLQRIEPKLKFNQDYVKIFLNRTCKKLDINTSIDEVLILGGKLFTKATHEIIKKWLEKQLILVKEETLWHDFSNQVLTWRKTAKKKLSNAVDQMQAQDLNHYFLATLRNGLLDNINPSEQQIISEINQFLMDQSLQNSLQHSSGKISEEIIDLTQEEGEEETGNNYYRTTGQASYTPALFTPYSSHKVNLTTRMDPLTYSNNSPQAMDTTDFDPTTYKQDTYTKLPMPEDPPPVEFIIPWF